MYERFTDGLRKAMQLSSQQVQEEVKQANLLGRGGFSYRGEMERRPDGRGSAVSEVLHRERR